MGGKSNPSEEKGRDRKSDAEARIAQAMTDREPMTKDKALDILGAFIDAGRVRKPGLGRGQ